MKKRSNMTAQNLDNLCDIIVSYKLKNYQTEIRNDDGVLVNGNSIKHNYNFVRFAYKYWIQPLELFCNNNTKNNKKKKYLIKDRINALALLVELDNRILINYFTTI